MSTRGAMTIALGVALSAALAACALDFGAFDPRDTTGPGAGGASTGGAAATGGSASSVGGVGGATTSAGGGGAGGGTLCGGLGVLSTDFLAGVQSQWWFDTGTAGSSIRAGMGGVLEFNFPGPGFAEYISRHYFRLDDYVQLELVDVEDLERLTLGIVVKNDTYLYFGRRNNGADLRYQLVIDNMTVGNVTLAPFDPIAHRWLRISRSATGVELEVSPDGTNFTGWPVFLTPGAFDFDHVRASIEANNFDGDFSQGDLAGTVDNFDAGTSTLCGSDTVVENFDNSSMALPVGMAESSQCNTTLTADSIIFNALAEGTVCEVGPVQGVTPTSVVAQFVGPVDLDASNSTHISLQFENGGEYASVSVSGGEWVCDVEPENGNGSQATGPAYDVATRFWRLSVIQDTLVAEVADDTLNWSVVCQLPFTPGPWPYNLNLHQHATSGAIVDGSAQLKAFNPSIP